MTIGILLRSEFLAWRDTKHEAIYLVFIIYRDVTMAQSPAAIAKEKVTRLLVIIEFISSYVSGKYSFQSW